MPPPTALIYRQLSVMSHVPHRLHRVTVHAFVDESKRGGYFLVAVTVPPHRLASARQQMRSLCMPGQQRVHFTKERPGRRGLIVSTITRLGIEAHIYDGCGQRGPQAPRRECLRQLLVDMTKISAQRLVIEQDDSLVPLDRKTLRATATDICGTSAPTYEHLPPRSEPLLWIPDAIAWCWTRDATWRARVAPLVTNVTKV